MLPRLYRRFCCHLMVDERGAGPRAAIGSQESGSAVGSTTGGQQGCYERLQGDGGPTRHVCLMGVSERDEVAVREVSLSFGKVSSIERNAKVRRDEQAGQLWWRHAPSLVGNFDVR